jgi:hypothetical protein
MATYELCVQDLKYYLEDGGRPLGWDEFYQFVNVLDNKLFEELRIAALVWKYGRL